MIVLRIQTSYMATYPQITKFSILQKNCVYGGYDLKLTIFMPKIAELFLFCIAIDAYSARIT